MNGDGTKEQPKKTIWLGYDGRGQPEAFNPATGRPEKLTDQERIQVDPYAVQKARRVDPPRDGPFKEMPGSSMGEVIFGIVLAVLAFWIVFAKNKPFRILVMIGLWLAAIFGLVFVVQFLRVFFDVTGVLR